MLAFFLALIALKISAQLLLERANRREVQRHSGVVPETFREVIDGPTYRKAVDYTLAKGRFGQLEISYDALILVLVLVTGILPAAYHWFIERFGGSALAQAAFLFLVGIALSLPSLPVNWVEQFRLEERFGFNNSTQKTWWSDRVKGLALSLACGLPLLWLVIKLIEWMGRGWWLAAWGILLAFQLLMAVLAPVLIMPLFNKLTPLPEGSLRARLLRLGQRTGFQSKNIQVMDGSKRSKHSNAFFTGFGRFRKIVLFDTLINQLAEPELEAVLAHEIGHYKKRHIPKMLAASAIGLLCTLAIIAWLAEQPWFYRSFGFEYASGNLVPAFLLFSLLSGALTFWLSPLFNLISRRFEYEADAYASQIMEEESSLVGALRKLNEKNLSNLTPHPAYSAFYYSHPTLLERERALKRPV